MQETYRTETKQLTGKVLVYEVPDGSNRKLYLSADYSINDYVVTMECDGEPTGFRVPLSAMQIKIPGLPQLPVDWDKAVYDLICLQS